MPSYAPGFNVIECSPGLLLLNFEGLLLDYGSVDYFVAVVFMSSLS